MWCWLWRRCEYIWDGTKEMERRTWVLPAAPPPEEVPHAESDQPDADGGHHDPRDRPLLNPLREDAKMAGEDVAEG